MTERRGDRARWTGAALVAPLAAVVFSGSTAWALHHDPRAGATAAAKPTAAPTADAALVALRQTLLDTAEQVAALRGQVAHLRATASALRVAGGSGGGRSTSSATTSSAPVVINVPAPAPAPATHTTTGGS